MNKLINEDYFKNMEQKLAIEKITVENFKEYYLRLKLAIINGKLENQLSYVTSLMGAFIFPVESADEREIVGLMLSDLDSIATTLAQEQITSINLTEYYSNFKSVSSKQAVSSKQLIDFYNFFMIAFFAKTSDVDLEEWHKLLSSTRLESCNYDEVEEVFFLRKKIKNLLRQIKRNDEIKKPYVKNISK